MPAPRPRAVRGRARSTRTGPACPAGLRWRGRRCAARGRGGRPVSRRARRSTRGRTRTRCRSRRAPRRASGGWDRRAPSPRRPTARCPRRRAGAAARPPLWEDRGRATRRCRARSSSSAPYLIRTFVRMFSLTTLLIAAAVVLSAYALLVVWLLVAGRRGDSRALAGFIADCVVLFRRLLHDRRV